MYKLHLILKYLRKRRIAWVSLVAVTLCTAMVLVVISVMGGWLRMFRDINHGLVGDVVVYRNSLTGFEHYEEILAAVRQMREVKAAVPMIHTYGLVNIDDQIRDGVEVVGYGDLDQVGDVNTFRNGLYRQYMKPMEDVDNDPNLSREQKEKKRAELNARPPSFDKPLADEDYKKRMFDAKVDVTKWPGIIVGTGVIIHKKEDGTDTRSSYMYRAWVKLTLLAMNGAGGTLDKTNVPERTYWIVDDCRTKFYPMDAKTVYVPFDRLQRDLGMAARNYTEKFGDKTFDGVLPARCNEVQIALKPGVDIDQARGAVESVVRSIERKYMVVSTEDPLRVETWEQRQGKFLSAVEKEKVLLTFLFGIISVVAIFLVFCIFFMIVVEKTRDIGIIKSVGATSQGVAAIFLGYGLAIGVVGAGAGLLIGYLIVHNINFLHEWMGKAMGVKIWDPETYAFDTIPNTMDPKDVMRIVGVAILSALLGAVIPAIRAARMNPVEALRWE